MTRGLLILLLLALPVATSAGLAPFTFGVVTHFAQSADRMDRQLNLVASAGIGSIRDEIYWSEVERFPGRLEMPPAWTRFVDGAVQRNIAPLLVLDYGNDHYDGGDKPRSDAAIAGFVRFATFVARQFRGQVHMYEVWNEWAGPLGHTTAGRKADYVQLLRRVAPALKEVDPSITVIADGILGDPPDKHIIADTVQSGILDLVDGIAPHPYVYNTGFDHTPDAWAERLERTETLLKAQAGKPVPLYVTETGWPTVRDGIDRQRAADYVTRMALLARTIPEVRGVWWYELSDSGEDVQNDQENFGLVDDALRPKPAYRAVEAFMPWLKSPLASGEGAKTGPGIRVVRFGGADSFWAMWSPGDACVRVALAAGGHDAPRATEQRGVLSTPRAIAWGAGTGVGDARAVLAVGAAPVLLRGLPDGARVDPEGVAPGGECR
jgi:hypothetical protein